ncbi:adenylate cyclase, partial [Mesorhizobium sp. LNJC374B00]
MSQSQVPAPPPGWLPDAWLRNARLVSGLVLMAFVTLHFLNHALLLISLEAADKGRAVFLLIWRNPAGTLLLYGAVATHLVLSLLALYHRRTLAMPVREWAQILLGLSIPLLIAEHVVGTRAMHALYEANDTYEFVVRSLWILTPQVGVRQAIAVVVIWAHGCLGLCFWLRYRRWYPRVASALLVLAVLVPVLALLGFASAGKEVSAMGPPQSQPIEPALFDRALATKERMDSSIYAGFAGLIVLVLAARIVRDRIERRNLIKVRYAGGRKVRIPRGYSVLDASRLGGIAHYAVCGGRGRCSTCRIRVVDGLAEQPEPSPIEAATLRRIAADGD